MSNTLSKYLNILTIVMLALTSVFVLMYFLGGDVPNQVHETPVYTDLLLNWTWVLMIISVGLAIIFPVIQIFVNPKAALKGLAGLGILGLIVLIGYATADDTLLNLPGYTGSDNTPATLIFADTVLNSMYILGAGTLISIVVMEIVRKFR